MKNVIKNIAGGKWWKVDFHVHTPASFDYGKGSENPDIDKEVEPKAFLYNAMDKGLDCLVISDHNTFSWIDKLREAAKEIEEEKAQNIVIFPAVEVNVAGNIHLLAIFNTDISITQLERIFGQFGYDESLQCTTKTMSEIMTIVSKNRGIAIPAHVDEPSGLFFSENQAATLIKPVLNLEELLAFELIGEKLENQLLTESKRRISYVSGSDSHRLDTVGKRFTWVKMGEPSIEAMRLALFDNSDGVIRSEYYEGDPNDLQNRMFLKSLEIKQAKYAGRRAPLKIEFSPWMTSIIGGRGTGKSSVIQFVRMILNKKTELPKSLVKEYEDFVNVPSNRSELGMLTNDTEVRATIVKEGIEYRFVWKDNDIYEELAGGIEKITNISERFPIRVFNQKQLFEMTKDPQVLLQYIDSQWNFGEWKKKMEYVRNKFSDCITRIEKNKIEISEKSGYTAQLREIENKISVFETEATKKVLDSQKELLMAEQQVKDIYRQYESILNKSMELNKEISSFSCMDKKIDKVDEETKSQIETWEKSILEYLKGFQLLYDNNTQIICTLEKWFNDLKIAANKKDNQSELNKLIGELKEQGVDDIEIYPILLNQKEELQVKLEKYFNTEKIASELNEEKNRILEEFFELLSLRIQSRLSTVSKWNEYGNLKITLLPMGDLEKNEEYFRSMIKKTGTTFSSDILEKNKDDVYCGGLIYNMACVNDNNYLGCYKDIIDKLLDCESDAFGKKFRGHINGLLDTDMSFEKELQMWMPEDLVKLELKVGKNKYISIDAGSAGQRTSAILTLLLYISLEPIIIDQPEDDLDTKNISDFIVKGINEKKASQQIIVVTHNPNIVVNTNSEQVIHMEYAGGEINASHAGALQDRDIRDAICDVMEGGREALESRYYRITKALE